MDPNLTRLLTSNQAPTSSERLQIQFRIRSSDVTLAEMDEQIRKLKLQRESTSTLRAAMQAVLSPVRRLPPEILAEIFLLCRNNSLGMGRYSVVDPRQAPLVLGQICSHWRAVSQNTSRLWDRIHVRGAMLAMRDASGRLGTCATRARNHPLDLAIHTLSYSVASGRFQPLDLVLPLRHKLQSIRLTLNWNECQNSGLPVDNTFPILTSLFINIRGSSQLAQPDLIRLVSSFGTLPTLQSLTLHAQYTSCDLLLSMVPWSQLTSLDLRVELKVVTAQQIVLQAQRLQTLVITDIKPSTDVPRILPIRVLPGMRYIKLSTKYLETTATFFQPFSFPNLKWFSLDAPDESQDVLLDIHDQSGFQLEELVLVNLKVRADGLSTFLRLLPRLIRLSLTHCRCLNSPFFTLFTYNPLSATPAISLPLLQIVRLEENSELLDGDVVAGMVESLCSPVEDRPARHPFPRVTRIELRLEGPQFDSHVESRLATLSATGFLRDFYERSDPSEYYASDSSSDSSSD
ncbi:hypothetical protein C8J57DRAFT_1479432 [Mycena rebaudengoi]|nr:hypothetical protein C8J57DRAFT_1479432 [Mycena rebaudengoi]